jgi:hypothetical protein
MKLQFLLVILGLFRYELENPGLTISDDDLFECKGTPRKFLTVPARYSSTCSAGSMCFETRLGAQTAVITGLSFYLRPLRSKRGSPETFR